MGYGDGRSLRSKGTDYLQSEVMWSNGLRLEYLALRLKSELGLTWDFYLWHGPEAADELEVWSDLEYLQRLDHMLMRDIVLIKVFTPTLYSTRT